MTKPKNSTHTKTQHSVSIPDKVNTADASETKDAGIFDQDLPVDSQPVIGSETSHDSVGQRLDEDIDDGGALCA
jgi:hypothetical protein